MTTDRKIAVMLFILALVYLILSYQLPEFPYAIMDSDVLPKGLGYLLLVLAIILFVESKTETEGQRKKRQLSKADRNMLLMVLVLVLLYVILLDTLGFVIVSILFLIGTTRLLGYTNWRVNILVSVLFTLGLYYAFNYLIKIYLPQGILPF
ncbi:tripartite tricarboxylate transporter TctB family protein [Caldalkalibacillus uzonensis]|nr:tripartite tricarboxylate transporter TctB family protein [Caldalkalibacillus uzonensis]